MGKSWTPLFLVLSVVALFAFSLPTAAAAKDLPADGDKAVATTAHFDQLMEILSYENHLPESWVGKAAALKTCGYVVNGKKTKCSGFRFCRRHKCVTILAIILPIIGGILIFIVAVLVICCCCATAITALCCCGGSREVDTTKTQQYPAGYQVNGQAGYQVNGQVQPAPVQV